MKKDQTNKNNRIFVKNCECKNVGLLTSSDDVCTETRFSVMSLVPSTRTRTGTFQA